MMERYTGFSNRLIKILIIACIMVLWYAGTIATENGEIRLIVRGDDIGSSHAANMGCIESYLNGVMRTVEVMVPCPWFKEAVRMLGENPGLDVGIHLTLTSEWEFYKWGPITRAPSLVDERGNFLPMTSQRDDFPPDTGFRESGFKLDEVERELRAQIELALREIPNISHLTAHMGTATCTPELRELVQKLSEEYKLPMTLPMEIKRLRAWDGSKATPEQKINALTKALEELEPGLWLFVDHPGKDTPEMRVIGHKGYEHVAVDRDGVTRAFTNEHVKRVIEKRGIQLVSYGDVLSE